MNIKEITLFEDSKENIKNIGDNVEFIHLESVIGSGYETKVAELALKDGVAYRAARKNMQIHSAIT